MFGFGHKSKFEPHDGFKSEKEEMYGIRGVGLSKPIPEDILYQADRCGLKTVHDFSTYSTYTEISGKYGPKMGAREGDFVTCRIDNNGKIIEDSTYDILDNAIKSMSGKA